MQTPEELKYPEEHEWVRVEGDLAVVGITDYAQGELGDIVFVELPAAGTQVKQGGIFGTEVINGSAYSECWMVKIQVADPKELDSLLDAAGYRAHTGEGG